MKMSWIVWVAIAAIAGIMVAVGVGADVTFSPLVLIAFGSLLDAYVGADQFAAVMMTRKMSQGIKFTGNRKKLIGIVFAALALSVEAFIFQALIARSGRTCQLPSMEFFAIFLFAAMFLAGGEKVKTANENEGPSSESEESLSA